MALGHLMVISVVSRKKSVLHCPTTEENSYPIPVFLVLFSNQKVTKKGVFCKTEFLFVRGCVLGVVWGSEKYARKLYEWYGSKFIVVGHRKRQKSTNKFRVNLKILVTRRRSFRCFLEAQLIFLTGQSWQHILKNMGPHGDPWVSMGTHGNPWGHMGTHGDSWEPMGTHGNP